MKGAILYEVEQKGNKNIPFGVASAAAMAYPAPPFMINGSAFKRTTPMKRIIDGVLKSLAAALDASGGYKAPTIVLA